MLQSHKYVGLFPAILPPKYTLSDRDGKEASLVTAVNTPSTYTLMINVS